jgi:hypothetical protein
MGNILHAVEYHFDAFFVRAQYEAEAHADGPQYAGEL